MTQKRVNFYANSPFMEKMIFYRIKKLCGWNFSYFEDLIVGKFAF